MEVAIFCKVIDNFGDAGFCLRLARGLSNKVKIVRVYCDNTALLKKLYTFCNHRNHSMPKNLIVCKYDSEFQLGEIVSLSLVVEAFQAEPLDKSGGYGIQGKAQEVIKKLNGSYSGVMGLPLFETSEMLQNLDL